MDYTKVGKQILERMGGKDNVISLVHCMTRLRFTLKDESIVDDELVKKTKGVMGIMKKSGQYQIIIGNEVGAVYKEICKLGNFQNNKKIQNNKPKEKQFARIIIITAFIGFNKSLKKPINNFVLILPIIVSDISIAPLVADK